MLRLLMKYGICYAASANTLKALEYIVVYGISEMSCYNPEYKTKLKIEKE